MIVENRNLVGFGKCIWPETVSHRHQLTANFQYTEHLVHCSFQVQNVMQRGVGDDEVEALVRKRYVGDASTDPVDFGKVHGADGSLQRAELKGGDPASCLLKSIG